MWNNDVKLQRISNHSSTYVRTKCPLEPTKFHKYTLHIYASITAFYYCAAYAHNNVWQYHIVSLKKICQIFRIAPLLPSGADLFVDGWIRAPQRPEIQSQTLNHPTDHFQVTLYSKNHPGLSSKNTIKLFTVKASTILSVLTWKILQHCTSVTRANWFGKFSASENSPVTLHKKLFCSELLD